MTAAGAWSTGWHLARRFAGSLRPGPPPTREEIWARRLLNPAEIGIWDRMSNPDRRHAVTVARAVAARTGGEAPPEVLVAALLHDCGKVVSGFGTMARVGATLVWAVVDDGRATRWLDSRVVVKRRLGQYRRHPELGSVLAESAGSHPLVVAWAAEHHQPPARWSAPARWAQVLKDCDDD